MARRKLVRRQATLRAHSTFESLETRCMLANVHWNVDADGFWDVAANWKDDLNVARVPGPSDDAFLDRVIAPFTITHRSGPDTVKSLHASSSGLVLSGGSLTNTETSDLGAAFTLSGGDLLARGPLTTAGNTSYTSGTIRSTGGIINTGQWTLSGSTLKQFGWSDSASGVFENRGTFVNNGTGNLGIWDHFTFTNAASGLLDIQGDTGVVNVGSGSDAFTNIGTLRKSAGSGTSTIASRVFSNAGGTIDVRSGTVAIATFEGVSTGGTFTVSAGATLDLAGGGSSATQYVGAYTGSGDGVVRVDTGTLKVGAAGATFNFPDHLFQWTSGTIDGGAAGLTNIGVMTFSGASTKRLNGMLHNAGTIIHAGAGILDARQNTVPTRLDNLPGGIYDFQADSSIGSGTIGDTAFTNAGVLRKSAGIGTSSISIGFNNLGGVIDVQTGILQLPTNAQFGAPKFAGGTFQAAAGAVLDLTGTTATISGNFTGSGQGAVRLSNGSLVVDPAGATFDFPAGLFQWTGGTINGIVAPLINRGSMTVNAIAALATLRGTLQNAGNVKQLDGVTLIIWGESGLGNLTNLVGGVYELQGAAEIQHAPLHGPGSAMHNFGSILKSIGTGTARIGAETFDNVGTVEVDAGPLRFERTVTQAQGTTLSGGTWKVGNGATLDFANSPRFTTNAAIVALDGPGSGFPAMETISTNTGSLALAGGRSLNVSLGRALRSFSTGLSLTGLAFDPATGNLFVYDSFGASIREYTPSGAELLPRIPIPGSGATTLDLDVTSTSLSVGGVTVPAGTLLVFRANTSPVYAIDKNTGAILASVTVSLPSAPFGGAYHAGRNTFFLVTGDKVYEVNPNTGSVLNSFVLQPAGTTPYFVSSDGDLEVDSTTGNLLVGARSQSDIREFTPSGQFVRDQNVTSFVAEGPSGMAFNEATRTLWVSTLPGTVYEIEAVFANSGSVTLGPGSAIDLSGTFTQAANGTFTTQIGGNPASGQFGHLSASNVAALGGTFGVQLVDGFGPVAGQQFPIIAFPSATGSFSTFTGLDGGRLPLFSVDQLPQSVVLRAVGNAADLAFSGFVAATFPATAASGQNNSVTYDIRNLSDQPALGDWYDSLYLSRDGSLDESDALLGRVHHTGGVAGNATYRETLTAAVPPLADGSYRVLVLSDSRGLIPDGNRANNVGFSSSTIAVTVPSLTLGTPVTGNIANGQDRYYRLTAPPGKDVKITAGFAATDVAEVFVRYRELPDRVNFDQATSASDRQQRLLITNSQGGSYYVLVHGREGSGTGASFSLLAEATGFEIVSITPGRGSNQGPATVQVIGSQFTRQTTLTLYNDSGQSRNAETVQFVDTNHLRATFDLVGLPTGNFRLRADDAGRTVDALDTFTVTGKPLGIVGLTIIAPAVVRTGSSIGVHIDITNGNDAQAVAPIMEIVATNVSGEKERFVSGQGLDALPGVLPPLYQGSASEPFDPDPKTAGTVSTFQLFTLNPTTTVIDWDSQKESLRHDRIPADAWDAIWANLRPVLGNTMADYYALLQNDARQLSQLGVQTNSIDQLYHFELRKANDLPALPVPAAAVDLAFPAPGLPLLFARDYGDSIAQRYYLGRLGRGWVDNFDVSLTNDTAASIVTILHGSVPRMFGKNKSGVYEGVPGDFATLTEIGSSFQLREKDGSVLVFRADGKLDYLQDTNGDRITAGYVGNQLTSLTHSNGSALTLTYNAQGRISQVSDPAGRVATYSYDPSGQNLTSVTTTEGTTEYTYTSETSGPRAHALTSIGYPTDTHLFFDYDSKGRLARQQQDGGAEQLTFTYDVTSYRVKDALGNVTDAYFDDTGHMQATVDGLGRTVQANYTGIFPTQVIAADGRSATSQYDDRGNAVQILDPLGQEQQFDYESTFNNLVAWRDALGHTTNFSYDPRGNPLSTTYPDGTVEQVTFDAAGNLVRSVDRLGQLISYTYDANGLVTRKDLPDGTHVDDTYDARANLLSATGPTGATLMEYDLADRMTKITYPGGRFLEFAYDAGGRRTQATDQSGFTEHYTYDPAGRLAQLTDGSGQVVAAYEYDSAGRLIRETQGNGTSTTSDYDAASQLLHLVNFAPDGTTILSRFDYTYDANGRRTSMTTLEGTTEYVYDAAGRLIQATLPPGRVLTYAYDAAGNRTVTSDNGATTAYAVNDMNQYVAVGGTSQSFDSDGNLGSSSGPSGPRSYRYDAEGQLISVVTAQGTWTYEYDALGNRLASTHNGVRTQYVIDPTGLGDVFGEYDGAGNLQSHYAHGLGLVSRIDVAGSAAYYQFDAVGNTAQLTDAAGTVLNSYSYLPFGEPLSTSESVPNPFTYVGQLGVMREGNGLDYMRNRWYDPVQGRFTQQDPIGLTGGTNLYSYAGNNPTNFTDPSGLVVSALAGSLGIAAEVLAGPVTINTVEFTTAYWGVFSMVQASGPQVGSASAYGFGQAGNAFAQRFTAEAIEQGVQQAEQIIARRAAQALARQALKAGSQEASLYGLLAAEIAFVGAIGGSINYGLYSIATTGDLPECVLPRLLSRAFELCKSPAISLTALELAKTLQTDPPSQDPNDIVGPGGFGTDGYLPGTPTLPYTIHFENAAAAGGPATEITVTQQLDADLDLDTFQLGDFGFGDLVVDVPDGRQYFHTRIDLREQPAGALTARQNLFVDVTAELDRTTRIVTWKFTTLDPETLDLPINPFLGFLPPDTTQGQGQGFVNYSVRPKADSPSGTQIDAQASVVFDANAPLPTNVFTNTLDVGPPTSSVSPLPAVSFTSDFPVSWTGSDDAGGSGIGGFDIFASDNGGPFALWKHEPGDTLSDTFSGVFGHTYAFYSVATDNVGHVEATPVAAQATTTVSVFTPDVADAGPDQAAAEGTQVMLDGSFVNSNPNDAPTYLWHLTSSNGQVVADGNALDFSFTPDDNGVYTATFTVTTGHGIFTDVAIIIVSNAVPSAAIGGPTGGTYGQSLGYSLTAADQSAVDVAAGFAYAIHWGDGTPDTTIPRTAGNASGLNLNHTFASAGQFTVQVAGTDKDGDTSQVSTLGVDIDTVHLRVTVDNKAKIYGQANPPLTATISGFVGGESLATSGVTGQPLLTLMGDGVHVGQYSITVGSNTLAATNYDFTELINGALNVTPAALTITADNKSKDYGATLPTLTANVTGFVGGDTAAILTAQPALATTAAATSHVGNYPITASGAAAGVDYAITYVPGTLNVTPVALQITTENKSKVYGAAILQLMAAYNGLVNGDTPASLNTQPTLATTATAASHVGTYPITASGAVDPDYTFDYVNGLFDVTPAALKITAENKSKVYGAAILQLTAAYDGLVNGDTPASLTTQPTLSTAATAASPVFDYPIAAGGAVDPDYTITYVPGTYSVTPAALLIAADSKTKLYGAAIPPLTASYNGFVNGDTSASLSTQPTLSTTATAASPVSNYPITATGASSTDYTISYGPAGTLSVTPAPLTIRADDKSKTAGSVNPPLTFTPTGFVNGDTVVSLATQPTLTTTATTSSPAGTYPITASGAANPNYTISYVPGTLTVSGEGSAGAITGTVYFDVTGNGISADDTPQVGVKVYLDTDNNGSLNSGEPVTTSLANGTYAFSGLAAAIYKVRQVVPTGYVRTAPTLADVYSITLASGQTSSGYNFANAAKGDLSVLSNIVYVINGTAAVSDLRGNTHEGDTIQVSFTVVAGAQPRRLTLVSYTAAGSTFDPVKASQQKIFDTDSGVFAPGSYTLTVSNPHSYYQVDFVVGYAIDRLGLANSNIFYSAQNRLFSADNAGTHTVLASAASLSGSVYLDSNNNGAIDPGERPIAGVKVTITGGPTTQTVVTDAYGFYTFDNLPAGTYTIIETQSSDFTDGKDTPGNKGGTIANDKFSGIVLAGGDSGTGYIFGEQLTVGSAFAGNQTQTTSYWNGSTGQALIKALNGSQSAKNLGSWLAASFNNLFGADAGTANNLSGKTNAQVAAYYQSLYANAAKKAEVEILALALAVYVTNSNLAGTIGTSYGFAVSTTGLGAATTNVGVNGADFGIGNNAVITIGELLSRTNARARKGTVWDVNGDGSLSGAESVLRTQAYSLFGAINNT